MEGTIIPNWIIWFGRGDAKMTKLCDSSFVAPLWESEQLPPLLDLLHLHPPEVLLVPCIRPWDIEPILNLCPCNRIPSLWSVIASCYSSRCWVDGIKIEVIKSYEDKTVPRKESCLQSHSL